MKINYSYFSALFKVLFMLLTFSMTLVLNAQTDSTQYKPGEGSGTPAGRDQKPSEGSQVTDVVPYEPQDIADAFVRNAVTLQDMELRAKYHAYMPGEIVVAMELETSKANAASVLGQFNWQNLFAQQGVKLNSVLMKVDRGSFRSIALVLLSLPEGVEVFDAMKKLEGKNGVLWSSPNFVYEGDPREFVPNDPSYASQYHHTLMKNNLAWDITLGSSSIIVGVTDDGVELTHSDLAPNIWTNTGEIAGDGIDNDSNGYIDDVNGWDFSSGNNNPNPNSLSDSHGTHVAGITAARTNNGIGVAGVAGNSTIMPLQFYGVGAWTAAVINASFTYAADNGAKIVNTSYNIDGWVGDPVFTAGLQYLYDAGVLHLNSAGNNNQLNPPRQAFHQTLLVASTDDSDVKSSFSNYGNGVDVSAPGSLIYSTVTGNNYDYYSGTSMATPNATGVAALIWSANPTWTRDQVAAQLVATADNIDAANPSLIGLLGSGRVNSNAALTTTLAPPQVKLLAGLPDEGEAVPVGSLSTISVAFNQVMNPASVNDPANFELRWAGLNGSFGDADDELIALTTSQVYMVGTNQMTFQISDLPLACGNYRFSLLSGGLENPFGTDLDGDGNGTGGDHYVRNFSLEIFYYFDEDGDGYGAGTAVSVCPPQPGYVLLDGDCDDNDPLINPGATEVCDGMDNNCDGKVDFPPVETYASSNVPVAISSSGTPTVTSNLTISGVTGDIVDLNVKNLNILHSWVGDLKVTLTSPGGTILVLFDRPGYTGSGFGCTQNNILASFDDEAALTADDFETTCSSSTTTTPPHTYAISGIYQPMDALSVLNGASPNGTWILTVIDAANGDGGSLEGWGLEISIPAATNIYYADADGDSYGDPNVSLELGCTPDPLLGWVLDNTDCDDANPEINPAATEVCDDVDNNCDGQIDEGSVCCTGNAIYFVNDDAVGLNDGSSWADAFTDLQSALNSTCPDITQIWVAAGTYYPTSGADRNVSFVMKNGVAIYGGFEGTEDPLSFDLADRDFVTNETILSGDLLGDDGNDFANYSDNSYHIIRNSSAIDKTAILDGFSISGGNADGPGSHSLGGGMFNSNASAIINNCTFTKNSSAHSGGAIYVSSGNVEITSSSFIDNYTLYVGGAISTHATTGKTVNLTLKDGSFTNNTSTYGGGAVNHGYTNSTGTGLFSCTNCTFTDNVSYNGSNYGGGGAFFNEALGFDGMFVNCLFDGNKGLGNDDWGGGTFLLFEGNCTIINSTIINSESGTVGGAISVWSENSVLELKNSILWNNTAVSENDIYNGNGGTVNAEYSLIQENECPANVNCGSGMIFGIDPLFVSPEDFHLQTCSPAIDAGIITGAPADDLDGNPRPFSPMGYNPATVDIGCFEYSITTDICAICPAMADAGNDGGIFPGDQYELLGASAGNYISVFWITNGDGSFDDETKLNPVYTPGINDIAAGGVELTLSIEGLNACGIGDNDQMFLSIYQPPTVEITSPLDGDILYDNALTVEGTAADINNDLAVIFVNLNGGGWEPAAGTDNWSKDLMLAIGENLIQAKAVDAQGIESEISEITVTLSIQVISIPQGWSVISAYLNPNDPALEVVMDDVTIPGSLTIMLGKNGIFWPDYNINTLGNWNLFEGYKVKYQQAVELTVHGNKLNDNSVTFSEGFHLIPVLSNVPSLISQVFANPANDLKYLFDLTSGQIYWPLGGIQTLTTLLPGKGYLANFNKQVTLNFPDYQALKSSAVVPDFVSEQAGPWEYSRSGEVHFISLFARAVEELGKYSHIGAFNSNGDCIGFAGLAGKNQNILLTVYGNDATNENKTGADAGELITFRAYDPSTGRETMLEPVYDIAFANHDGLFALNGLSAIVEFKESATGSGDPALLSKISLYPNPASERVTITLSGNDGEVECTILDVDGKQVLQSYFTGNEAVLDLSNLRPGMYVLRLDLKGEIVTRRIVVM